MGVHVLSSTTTVVGVGWFSMAMCVVYVCGCVVARDVPCTLPPMYVRARTSREGGTDSPSAISTPPWKVSNRLDDSRIRSAVATAHCVPRSQAEVLFTTGLRLA